MRLNPISVLFKFAGWKADANQIKNDPERKEKSIKFGVSSIVQSIVAFACTCGIFLFPIFQDTSIVLFVLVGICFGIGLPVAGLINYVGALTKTLLQFSINKKKIGLISLLILVVLVIASAVVLYFALTGISV